MSKIWLITGSGNGLGHDIADAALAAGNQVLATARDTGQLAGLTNKYGNRLHTARLDVTDEAQAQAAVQTAAMAIYARSRRSVQPISRSWSTRCSTASCISRGPFCP
jgi:NADP-dependent 3-hydroxy acid dehydrogenase YdfG